jgi:hypothetical protein
MDTEYTPSPLGIINPLLKLFKPTVLQAAREEEEKEAGPANNRIVLLSRETKDTLTDFILQRNAWEFIGAANAYHLYGNISDSLLAYLKSNALYHFNTVYLRIAENRIKNYEAYIWLFHTERKPKAFETSFYIHIAGFCRKGTREAGHSYPIDQETISNISEFVKVYRENPLENIENMAEILHYTGKVLSSFYKSKVLVEYSEKEKRVVFC